MAYNPSNPNGAASSSSSQSVVQALDTATGNITTQNLVPAGTATANSAVEIAVLSAGSVTIGVTGTFTATLSVQVTIDGTNWSTLTYNSLTNVINGGAQANTTTTGVFTLQTAGWLRMRITALTAVTGTAVISLRAVNPSSVAAINSPLPTGTNAIGSAALNFTSLIADVTSAAITSTTTTAAFVPSNGVAYSVSIPVTASSGTNKTLDVNIEESDDNGTNWFVVYSFPRITGNGIFRSPMLTLRGNRVRYVQTVGGTSPSFTRSINRLQSNGLPQLTISQLIDRTVSITTLNATTPILDVQNAKNLQIVINMGAATTAPTFRMEGSYDNGVTWLAIQTLVGEANATVESTTVTVVNAQLVRAKVTTVGASATLGYVLIKGF